MFTEEDYKLIDREFEGLKAASRKRCADDEQYQLVLKAFEFANEAHKDVRRRSGEPYMLHPIAVAKIVVDEIGLGCKSICAALLHDVVEDTEYTVEDIQRLFGDKIASLVDGLTKIKTALDNESRSGKSSLQAENFKRILITLNDDVRIILIKLADRLHNVRTIQFMPEYKRDKILSETMYIFIPLAHRLGLYEVKSEMENIWLRYKEPDAYKEITRRIDASVVDKDKSIDDFIAPINEALLKAGFDFRIKKRIKTPYSVWNKMKTKNVEFEQVYDLYAVRIIFNPPADSKESERDQCYHIFSIITGIYKYQPSRVRDWVKHTKSNGYEALHCTLMSQIGIWIEVQIRSKRMDDIAEKGIAAHWAYKNEGYVGENDSEMDKWLEKVKDILVSEDVNALELLDIIHNDLTSSDIVVFTPKGDQKTIMKGATALDFAYLIHTHIGNKAIAAKVNMKLVPLSYVLKSGDQVEIITAQKSSPKSEWLQFLQTRHARNLVIENFKDQRDEITARGEKMLHLELDNYGIPNTKSNVQKLLMATQLRDLDEFCFRLGLGLIKPGTIVRALNPSIRQGRSINPVNFKVRPGDPSGKKFVLASCCNPIPGDPVVGYITRGTGVSVHRRDCVNVLNATPADVARMVDVAWDIGVEDVFKVTIFVLSADRPGLMVDMLAIVSDEKVNIYDLKTHTDKNKRASIHIGMDVNSLDQVERVMNRIRRMKDVYSVEREISGTANRQHAASCEHHHAKESK